MPEIRSWIQAIFLRWERTAGLVVLLVKNRFSIPAQALQQLSIGLDHLVQTADVGVHVGATLDDPRDMFLDVSAQALPIGSAAAQSRQILKVRMPGGQV